MRYSLAKVAKELGLSKATVSLILNGKAREMRISEELELKVKAFCEKVNYVPNIHAQRINQKYVKSVGLLIDQSAKADSDNPFSDPNIGAITGGIALAAEEKDYRISIQLHSANMDESNVFDWLRNHEIDGLIYYGLDLPSSWRKVLTEEKRSVVGIGIEPSTNIAGVNINNFEASANLTKQLIESGRKRFCYVTGIEDSYVSSERLKGFLSAVKEFGLDFSIDNIICADYSETKAESLFIDGVPNVDAIVCANDDMAIGVIKALKKHGVDIPRQIAVAGADNIPTGAYITPSLTTFDNKPEELGKAAFHCLLNMIKGNKPKNIVLTSEVITREST